METESTASVGRWSHRPIKGMELTCHRHPDGVRLRVQTISSRGNYDDLFDILVPTTAFQAMLDMGFTVRSVGEAAIFWRRDPEMDAYVISVRQHNGPLLRYPITVPCQEIILALGLGDVQSLQDA